MNGFFTKLVGVTFQNNDGSSRQQFLSELADDFDPKSKVLLKAKRDLENPYDDKAIAIYDEQGRQLGYLSRKVNENVAPWIDGGSELLVEVVTFTGGDGNHWGANIWIEKKRKSA